MHLPAWLLETIKKENFSCPQCKNPFDANYILFCGIRPVDHNGDQCEMLCIQYRCQGCKQTIGYDVMSMTLKEFAISMLDENLDPAIKNKPSKGIKGLTPPRKPEPAKDVEEETYEEEETPSKPKEKGRNKSRITTGEKRIAMDMMDSSPTWEEWLTRIGAPKDEKEIDKNKTNFKIKNGDAENEQNK